MGRIQLTTRIRAPIERCFDLARSIDVHVVSMGHSSEIAIAGVTQGLIESGQEVTWRARHFGVVWHHTSRITEFAQPFHFRDEMVRGAFACFRHDHNFESDGEFTVMSDLIDFDSPFGWAGALLDRLFLERYLIRLISIRNDEIKRVAESDLWKRFLLAN